MNESCTTNMMICHKCKILRWNVYNTKNVSQHRFLCRKCAGEEGLIGNCLECGREGIQSELNKHGGYCHKCEKDNIIECKYCGDEIYINDSTDGSCIKCDSGENKECIKCGTYTKSDKLTSDGLCSKCSIKIHKQLRKSEINEIVECLECGREALVNDINNKGLCIYCSAVVLENEVKKIKRKRKAYY